MLRNAISTFVALAVVLFSTQVFAVDPDITLATGVLNYTDVESDTFQAISQGAVFADVDGVSGDAELIVAADGTTGGNNGISLDELYLNTNGTGLTLELAPGKNFSVLLLNGVQIADLAAGSGEAPLYVKFENHTTEAQVQTVLENILWRNRANQPRASRTFEFIIKDDGVVKDTENLIINVSNANEPPVNRTDQVMTALNPTEIRNEYFNGVDWHLDRFLPESFTPVVFDGDSRFQLVINDDNSSANYQGYLYPAENAKRVSVEMFVPSDWGAAGGAAPNLWINAFTNDGERVEYPIIQIRQDAGQPNPAHLDFYTNAWEPHDLPADVQLDTWMTLEVTVDSGDISFSVKGTRTNGQAFEVTGTQPGTTVDALWQPSFQPAVAAAGQTYTVYYDNYTFDSGNSNTNEVWQTYSAQPGDVIQPDGLAIDDVDAGDTLSTTFQSDACQFAAIGQLGAVVTGTGSYELNITGSVAQINATLATLTIQVAEFANGNEVITVTTEDVGGLMDTDTIVVATPFINSVPIFTPLGFALFTGLLILLGSGKLRKKFLESSAGF